jgi:hypothetical protein
MARLTGVPIRGFRLVSKGGRISIQRDERRLDVSTRLKQRSSKRVRPARPGQIAS